TDPQLYRYGVHATDFWVNVTVGPGKYHARLKWDASRGQDTRSNCFDIWINGRRVVERFDVSATAAGHDRAVDLVFNALEPRNGIIEVRLTGTERLEGAKTVRGEAFLQALEIGLGNGGHGPKPVSVPAQ
ncbi:MAG: malectin domain-containing carbohydrate-binding protein, partial [Limisphaerales bacterium]